jgi:hypothetical protein
VATLSRVVFPHPADATQILAFEHKATVHPGDGHPKVSVQVQPFGGAVRILNQEQLLERIGPFNFDSERSRADRDFRLFINPSDWRKVKDICQKECELKDCTILEVDPSRELMEEIYDALGIHLNGNEYTVKWIKMAVEKNPSPTLNVRAPGHPTFRIYLIYQAYVKDHELCRQMLESSELQTAVDLKAEALADAYEGGRGRANAIWIAPWDSILTYYLGLAPEERTSSVSFSGVRLSGNVPVVLEGISTPDTNFLP